AASLGQAMVDFAQRGTEARILIANLEQEPVAVGDEPVLTIHFAASATEPPTQLLPRVDRIQVAGKDNKPLDGKMKLRLAPAVASRNY
ncbi:hypothetical protein FJY63_06240, partial [Candidatus Sumerlaeota bacterium]|nr:hypothetical protein [Candidatus Sumerlaeota bacterium]